MTISAGVAGLVLPVAIHARAHRDIHLFTDDIALAHRTMARFACRPGLGVRSMAEEYKAGDLVDPHPWDKLLLFCSRRDLGDVRAVSLYRLVTAHAITRCREAHHLARIGILVTIAALEPE